MRSTKSRRGWLLPVQPVLEGCLLTCGGSLLPSARRLPILRYCPRHFLMVDHCLEGKWRGERLKANLISKMVNRPSRGTLGF